MKHGEAALPGEHSNKIPGGGEVEGVLFVGGGRWSVQQREDMRVLCERACGCRVLEHLCVRRRRGRQRWWWSWWISYKRLKSNLSDVENEAERIRLQSAVLVL